jgi:hypothetical protein
LAAPHRAKQGLGTFTIGKETTFVTGPLNDDGHIDYAAALNERISKGVTPESNAKAMIWNALGPVPSGTSFAPDGYFEKLGIPRPQVTADNFISAKRYVLWQLKGTDEEVGAFQQKLARFGQEPWRAKDNPDLAGWLKENEQVLSLVPEAARCPRYYSPLMATNNHRGERNPLLLDPFPALQPTRELVAALSARVMLSIGEGRVDKATWQDVLTCQRLARLVGSGATLIEGAVGVSFERIATHASLALLQETKPDAKQLQAYLAAVGSLQPWPEMAEKTDLADRFAFLDTVMLLDRYGLGYVERIAGLPETPKLIAEAGLDGIDWDPALATMNRWFDRIRTAMRQATPAERSRMFDQIEVDLRTHKQELTDSVKLKAKLVGLEPAEGKGQLLGDYLITVIPVSAFRKLQTARDETEQTHRNVTVAFALEWYQRDNGRYPDTLDPLAPKYLLQVPKDLFSGGALVYRPAGTGNGYLLYSVGVNEKDDGGRGPDDQPPGDDLVVRMPVPVK